jgi:hypothetical protein
MSANNEKTMAEPEMVLVPRRATKEMIDAAYWTAHDENAESVWDEMIAAWLQSQSSGKSSGGSD